MEFCQCKDNTVYVTKLWKNELQKSFDYFWLGLFLPQEDFIKREREKE